MTLRLSAVAGVALIMTARAALAHDGAHGDETQTPEVSVNAPDTDTSRPHWLPGGQLFVPKALQRTLGLRTQRVAQDRRPGRARFLAEVIADRDASGSVKATQAGSLEVAQQWPLQGQTVKAGEVLAWIRPLMPQREEARRRVELAKLDQRLYIANVNRERLRIQNEATGDQPSVGNVYFGQADLEWRSLKRQREMLADSLEDRLAVKAPVAGLLYAAPVREGDVVMPGQTLFEVASPQRFQLAVTSFDPSLASHINAARAQISPQQPVDIVLRGLEPLSGKPGWRLLFQTASAVPISRLPGELLEVEIESFTENTPALADACIVGAGGQAEVWVHSSAELFSPRAVANCQSAAPPTSSGERWVTRGAVLLAQYKAGTK